MEAADKNASVIRQDWRSLRSWLDSPTAARVLRFLRRHWLESIALASLIGLVIAVDPVKLIRTLRSVNPTLLGLMLPVVLAVYVFRALGWWVALRHVGVRITVFRAVYIMFAGQIMIFLPAGDLARVALVQRTGASGRDAGTVAGTIAFQELIFLGLLGLGVLPRVAMHPDIAILVLVMTLAHAGIFVILLWEPAYDWAVRLVERIASLRRFDPQLRSLRPAFVEMMAPWNLVGVVGLSAIAAGLLYLLFYLALQAVGVHSVSFTEASFAYGLGHIFSGLSFLPGGVGSMEAIVTGLLAARGVPASQGAAAALLFRGFNNVVMALFGALAGLLVWRRSAQEHDAETERIQTATTDVLDGRANRM